MRKVLVIGGNGFIGKNLMKELIRRGNAVICFDLNSTEEVISEVVYIQGSFFEEEKITEALEGVDVVFHAISSINPGNSNIKYMQGYEKDFIHTLKLCNKVMERGIKMVFLSSGGTVYGQQEGQPIKEEAPKFPINHYGNVKLCMENTMRTFNRQNKTNIKIARIANPYGMGQDFSKGVGFIDAVLKNGIRKDVVEIYGNGEVIRDYIYIDDVCSMLCSLMDYEGHEEVFNLSTGFGKSQNEIIELAKLWIPDLRIEYKDARAIDVPTIILDNSKIRGIIELLPMNLGQGMHLYYQCLMRDLGKGILWNENQV